MNIASFIQTLTEQPEGIDFNDTLAVIDAHYRFTPTAFKNGQQHNAAGQNNGSCKLFAFASLQQLDEQQTLACFGKYYRDVLNHPHGDDHQNIRNFMQTGWAGISFDTMPLTVIHNQENQHEPI